MKPIESLDALVKRLKENPPKNYVTLAKDMKLPVADFKEYEYWSQEKYTRNCIARTDQFELMLLCWQPGQTTPIHGHGGQRCWVYQVEGNIHEVRYQEKDDGSLEINQKLDLKPEELSYMDDRMGFHYLENNTKQRAMTLHLYMLPIDECKIYNPESKEFNYKEMEYDTFRGKYSKISSD